MGIWRYGVVVTGGRCRRPGDQHSMATGEHCTGARTPDAGRWARSGPRTRTVTRGSAMARGIHVPVQLERCLELLRPALSRADAVHVDATLGLGGHAEAVLEAFPRVTLVGIDRDPQALALASDRLAAHAG